MSDKQPPPMRIRNTTVKASDLKNEGPIYRPLVDIIVSGRKPDEGRMVLPHDLQIDTAFRAPRESLAIFIHGFREIVMHQQEHTEHGVVIVVLERSDGSLWVYDDCAFVEAAQIVAPDQPLTCMIWRDPTQ